MKFFGEWRAWKAHREAFRKGEITLREYQELSFNGVDATLEEMSEGLKGMCWPREGVFGLCNLLCNIRYPSGYRNQWTAILC